MHKPVVIPERSRTAHEPPAKDHDLLAVAIGAASRALQQHESVFTHDAALAQLALEELESALRNPERVTHTVRSSPWTALARPLLNVIRRQILHAAHAAGDSEAFKESHRLLLLLERVHDALQADELYCVADQLSGAGALDLLVEVAHDMRSPLGSILFLVDRVRSGQSGALSEPAARQLGLAYSAAFGLSAITSDLMQLARGDGRLVGPAREPFSLADAFRRIQDLVSPLADEKGLRLVMDKPPRDLRLGHPAALVRVLLNLATNACKYTARGDVLVRAIQEPGDRVRFEVEDSGRGIPAEAAARLYETFVPRTGSGASAGAYAFSSAGLGLAICRKLVFAMGGDLGMESSALTGTCFRFTLELPRG